MIKRTIYHNPTGKPFCCHPECNADATTTIINPPFGPEDTTDACDEHIGYLSDSVDSRAFAIEVTA